MRRLAAATTALALGLAVALALTSCGSDSKAKLLPGTTAQEITENLQSVRDLAAEGECADAEDKAVQISSQVEALEGIDQKLKEALQSGAERLNEVVLTCTETTTEEEEPEETLPTTTETTTAPPSKTKKPGKEKHEVAPPPEKEQQEPPEESTPPPPKGEAKGPEETGEVGEAEPPSGGIGPGAGGGD